jgi:hypothetical protein
MNKFGAIKNKLLLKLTESYSNGDKKTIGEILKSIKSNKQFKELYVFYENFERQHFDSVELAEQYIESISKILNGRLNEIEVLNKQYAKLVDGVVSESNELYDSLDLLTESDTILNVADKIKAKKYLIGHLMEVKEIDESSDVIVENEKLLYAVLTNNFNVKYNDILSEEEKIELKSLISLTDEEVETRITELKENISNKINNLLTESHTPEFAEKLKETELLTKQMKSSKYNLFKLKQLKTDLE